MGPRHYESQQAKSQELARRVEDPPELSRAGDFGWSFGQGGSGLGL